jgi:hypothetical protein
MAKRPVIEINCDRCHRTETQPMPTNAPAQSPTPATAPEFTATCHGVAVTYQDLCGNCRDAVQNYFNSIIKKPKEPEAPAPAATEKKGFLGMGKG